jgi:hypothetical protein
MDTGIVDDDNSRFDCTDLSPLLLLLIALIGVKMNVQHAVMTLLTFVGKFVR